MELFVVGKRRVKKFVFVLFFLHFVMALVSLPLAKLSAAVDTASISKTSTTIKEEASKSSVLTFKEWREQVAKDSRLKVNSLNTDLSRQIDVSKNFSKTDDLRASNHLIDDLKRQVQIEKMRYEATAELSLREYFVAYLMASKGVDQRILELSKRLSPEEVAQLLRSYAEIVSQSRHSLGIQSSTQAQAPSNEQ